MIESTKMLQRSIHKTGMFKIEEEIEAVVAGRKISESGSNPAWAILIFIPRQIHSMNLDPSTLIRINLVLTLEQSLICQIWRVEVLIKKVV